MKKKAKTYDKGKPPLAFLPTAGMRAVANAQQFGYEKYKDFHNYRNGFKASTLCSCAMRHIAEFMDGHDVDKESGLHPIAHATTRLMFLLQNLEDGVLIDDRYKRPAKQPTRKVYAKHHKG